MMSPAVRRTWALQGMGAQIECRTRHHQKVSCIGALSISPARRPKLMLRFHAKRSICKEQTVSFLSELRKNLRGKIIIVWDNLQAHRSRLVREWVDRHPSVKLEFLPGYAPELKPIEPAWGYAKYNPLANFCPKDAEELHAKVYKETRRMRKKTNLLKSFIKMTPLTIRLQ